MSREFFDKVQELRNVHSAVLSSRQMLQLEENWDGEDARPVLESTWKRATHFLWRIAVTLWKEDNISIPPPEIDPVPDGSIDIDWRLNGRELLINIPPDPDKPTTYYGDDGAGGKVNKGELNTSESNHWLLVWLLE